MDIFLGSCLFWIIFLGPSIILSNFLGFAHFFGNLFMGGFQKNEVFFNIKAGLISFIHIRSHLYLKCVLSRCQTPCKIS